MEKQLQQIGLTENEAKIYLTLLDIGPSLAGMISRKSGIHRRSVYDAIDRLIEKGLIGYITKNNRKYFEAVNPSILLNLLKEKEESVKEILPQLESKFNLTKEKQETLFFRGKSGLKTAFEDQILTGKEILIFGASPIANEILKFYFKWFDKRRVEKKIKVKIIFDSSIRNKLQKIPLSEIRFLPKEYSTPAATNIYADKISIILWSKENPLAIIIKQKEIADSYRKFFNLMWKISRK